MKKTNKKYLFGLIILVLGAYLIISNFNKENASIKEVSALEEQFNMLSNQKTNLCAGPNFIDSKSDKDRIQGACCSAMDLHRYKEQVEGLKELREKYSNLGDDLRLIVEDPYDIPVSLARELLEYQKTITLTPEQQEIYNQAMKLSHEGGPCCCKCWRWYAFEGQAKKLIVDHNFSSEQIAELWDIQDGCGGAGHEGHEEGMEGH